MYMYMLILPKGVQKIISICHRCHLEMRISPRNFEKIQNGPNGIIRGLGETDQCRKPKVENVVALSL
jgi:hypothetical protein